MALVVLTGGARCGKSSVAQTLAAKSPGDVSVAVFGAAATDDEMAERVRRHQEDRPDEWTTVEAADSVEWTERVRDGILIVDCVGSLLARVMDEVLVDMTSNTTARAGYDSLPDGYTAEVERRFVPILGWITRRLDDTIVVTNEVGEGVIPPYPSGRVFRDVLGRGNRALVDRSDSAYLVVAGRCFDLHALPQEVWWPR